MTGWVQLCMSPWNPWSTKQQTEWLASRLPESKHGYCKKGLSKGRIKHIPCQSVCSGHTSNLFTAHLAKLEETRLVSWTGEEKDLHFCTIYILQYQPTRRQEQGHLGGSCLPTAPSSHHRQSKCGSSYLPTRPSLPQRQSLLLQWWLSRL